jgi:hypothetical protein
MAATIDILAILPAQSSDQTGPWQTRLVCLVPGKESRRPGVGQAPLLASWLVEEREGRRGGERGVRGHAGELGGVGAGAGGLPRGWGTAWGLAK